MLLLTAPAAVEELEPPEVAVEPPNNVEML
jgi:hypothetical protein